MKRWMLYAALVLCLLLSGGCTGGEEGAVEEADEQTDRLQIGMSFDSFVIERWQRDRDIFVSTAKEMGAEVNVQNASGNLEEQVAQIEYFIDKEMDVIVIICIDSDSLADVVRKAKSEGIKVIAYDRLIKNSDVDLYISFDNEAVGEMMAQGIVNSGQDVKSVLMLGGPLADNNVSLVEKGFRRVMQEHQIEVLDAIHADGWKAELGSEYIYSHADVVSRADAIMCGNDDIATAVVRALSERRLAQKAAECAIALGEGRDVETDSVIYDGSGLVPYVALEPISVYKDNMDDVIINSGFHLKEDVYLNMPELRMEKSETEAVED